MTKILIALKDMKIGGIEKSAIELIKYLKEKGYKITLILEEKTGELLEQIDSEIKIIEYKPCKSKLFRKIINCFKRIKFILKYRNKFDISISYTTYSKMCSFVTRMASKTSILWCHADYVELYNREISQVEEFFGKIKYYKFSKIVFVSKAGKKSFEQIFKQYKSTYFCNNLIDPEKIYKMALEEIELKYNKELTTFINVGRHDEKQKKLSRIIKACYYLEKDDYDFRCILVGQGKDTKKYKNMVKKYNLEDKIIFVGEKTNPYPYYKIADCIVLSSDYEGYPIVFLESFLLGKTIITTDVSDYEDIKSNRGIVVKKNPTEIYIAMKNFIKGKYKIKNDFDIVKYNEQIRKKLDEILKK